MIQTILKAKHWQFFLLSYAVPMVLQFFFMNNMMQQMVTEMERQQTFDPTIMFGQMAWMPLVILPFMFLLLAWQWAVVVGLNAKLSDDLKFGLTKFKVFFFFPIIYIAAFTIGMVYVLNTIFPSILDQSAVQDLAKYGTSILFIIPLHFFAVFCMFYVMYYVAKTIKTLELQRATTFSDFVGEFFLMWFFPIGIWILQPRINDLIEEKDELVNQLVE